MRGSTTAAAAAAVVLTLAGCADDGGENGDDRAGSPAASGSSGPPTSASTAPPDRKAAGGPTWTSPEHPVLSVAWESERQDNYIEALSFAPDGRTFAWSDGNLVRVWDSQGSEQTVWSGHDDYVTDLAYSPDGRTLASVGDDGTLRLWDVATGQASVVQVEPAGEDELLAVAWKPDGTALVTGGPSDVPLRVHRPDGQVEHELETGASTVSLAFSPDGAKLAVGQIRGLQVWETATWTEVASADAVDAYVLETGWSGDGTQVYTGSDRAVAEVRDATTLEPAQTLTFTDQVGALDVSPDGRLLVLGDYDYLLRVYGSDGFDVLVEQKMGVSVRELAWSPTEPLLLVAQGQFLTALSVS